MSLCVIITFAKLEVDGQYMSTQIISIAASNVDCPIMTDVTKKMYLILHSENECKLFEVY